MPRHRESRALPWSAEQMFDLVADIGRYPEFLPWVLGMRIRPATVAETSPVVTADMPAVITADMVVGFKMVREYFTSRVTLDRPGRIHVDYLDGPLKYLHNDWLFRPAASGCTIDFAVEFEFKSRTFEKLAGLFFGEALSRMVKSFEARADAIYGGAVRQPDQALVARPHLT